MLLSTSIAVVGQVPVVPVVSCSSCLNPVSIVFEDPSFEFSMTKMRFPPGSLSGMVAPTATDVPTCV